VVPTLIKLGAIPQEQALKTIRAIEEVLNIEQ
jgi:hypothetical protein